MDKTCIIGEFSPSLEKRGHWYNFVIFSPYFLHEILVASRLYLQSCHSFHRACKRKKIDEVSEQHPLDSCACTFSDVTQTVK